MVKQGNMVVSVCDYIIIFLQCQLSHKYRSTKVKLCISYANVYFFGVSFHVNNALLMLRYATFRLKPYFQDKTY